MDEMLHLSNLPVVCKEKKVSKVAILVPPRQQNEVVGWNFGGCIIIRFSFYIILIHHNSISISLNQHNTSSSSYRFSFSLFHLVSQYEFAIAKY
ncbi:hypothetical protein RIF29_00692 [Crotalaria pallida]|uniref:Uncharacterized protein n=1 Tax=Crotalaria pallida TaxID=3830 RepID=A0AAN9P766_CROPI